MSDWDDRRILSDLEREIGGAELSAVLSEWITTVIHRITAVSLALGWWRTQMIMQGYSAETTESTVPMMLERLWLIPSSEMPLDEIIELISSRIDDSRSDSDDGDNSAEE